MCETDPRWAALRDAADVAEPVDLGAGISTARPMSGEQKLRRARGELASAKGRLEELSPGTTLDEHLDSLPASTVIRARNRAKIAMIQ